MFQDTFDIVETQSGQAFLEKIYCVMMMTNQLFPSTQLTENPRNLFTVSLFDKRKFRLNIGCWNRFLAVVEEAG